MRGMTIAAAAMWTIAMGAYGQNDGDYLGSDRPGIADSSEVVGPGRWQMETGLVREARRSAEDPVRTVFFPTLLRLGLNEHWEVRLESDVYAWMRDSDGTRTQAHAPFSVGFKYRFMEAAGAGPSLAAIARITPPSGSNRLKTRRTTADLRVAADWQLSRQWSLNPNIGWAIDEDDEGRRFNAALFAVTLAYKPVPALELFVDTGAQKPEARGAGSAVVYDAGIAYLVSRDIQIDLSAGVRGAGSTPPRSFVATGLSIRF